MSTATQWVRRHRALLLIATFVAVLVVGSVALGGGPTRTVENLDPDNPGLNGAQAVARVLEDDGVDVRIARGAQELESLDLGAGTTVVVTSSYQLGESTVARLLAHSSGSRLVVVEPPPVVVDAFHLDVDTFHPRVTEPVEADCGSDVLSGLEIDVDGAVAYDGPGTACFPWDDRALHLQADDGTTLLGAGSILANDQITRADNAAAALRILGQDPTLVWYVPDSADLTATDAVSLGSLLPDWLYPALGLVFAAVLALIGWRGRRLGALVVEPLPVTVKAIETTHSRGRLYRKARDRGHATDILRRAARDRLAVRLRLPRAMAEDAALMAREVAARTSRPEAEVRLLIASDEPPRTDDELIRLASDLAELEREAAHRP